MSREKIHFIDILQRLKYFSGLKKDSNIAELIGITRGNLSALKNRNSIPYETLFTYCRKNGLNLHWLLTGTGSMFTDESAPDRSETLTDKTIGMIKTLEADDLRAVHGIIEEKLRLRAMEKRMKDLEAILPPANFPIGGTIEDSD